MKNTFTSSSSQATDLLQAQGGQDVLLALALLLKTLHLDEQHDSWTETPSAQVEQWEFVICQFLLNIVHQQIRLFIYKRHIVWNTIEEKGRSSSKFNGSKIK